MPAPVIPAAVPQEFDPAVPLGKLTPHPANPNEGDTGLIAELLAANGFAGAVLAQKSTGIIIDGEYRWLAAQEQGMDTVPVLWADVDDDTRDRLLASINESARRGRTDEEQLLALLTPFTGTPKGLAGTAFTGDDLDDLVARVQGPLILDPGGDGTTTNDDPGQAEQRARAGGTSVAGRGLRDIILVLPVPDADRLAGYVTRLKAAWGDQLSQAEVVLRACQIADQHLGGDG